MARFPVPLRAGVVVAAALVATACGSGSGGGYGSGSGGGSGGGGSSGGSSGTVITTRSGADGTYLTDSSGRAVYLWVKDPKDKSVCSGACAGAWPPVPASGQVTASGGAKTADLGTITGAGGKKQVTYDGHPLYYFAGDSGAGQTNGQGSNGFGAKWWLVAPSGSAITSGSGPAGKPSSSASSGYGNGY
ncbi:MAG: hypothetical protein J2P25_13080 [Nocardiopsaceae bacterium]|nr:hypothetical protein [Nocardiopsaceae bacterium]